MDANRFNAFSRAVNLAATRRDNLGRLLGAALAALLARFGATDVEAKKKKRKKKKKCKGGKKKCGKKCVDLASNGAHCRACGNACATGGCVHGACTCDTGEDCPEGCFCTPGAEGGHLCSQSFSAGGALCVVDETCPLGSFCSIINTCTIPCPV
jgi:hypothetical protein